MPLKIGLVYLMLIASYTNLKAFLVLWLSKAVWICLIFSFHRIFLELLITVALIPSFCCFCNPFRRRVIELYFFVLGFRIFSNDYDCLSKNCLVLEILQKFFVFICISNLFLKKLIGCGFSFTIFLSIFS